MFRTSNQWSINWIGSNYCTGVVKDVLNNISLFLVVRNYCLLRPFNYVIVLTLIHGVGCRYSWLSLLFPCQKKLTPTLWGWCGANKSNSVSKSLKLRQCNLLYKLATCCSHEKPVGNCRFLNRELAIIVKYFDSWI